MKTFRFLAFQNFKTSYQGYLEIKTNTPEEAQEKLENMSQDNIIKKCFNWVHNGDDNRDIDIDSASIHEI